MKLIDNLITCLYFKKVSGPKITYTVRDQSDSVMYRLLLSRVITGPSFNFIPYMDLPYILASFHSRFQGGVHNPLLNNSYTKNAQHRKG